MSNLTDFYKVLNTVELSVEDHKTLCDAALELANAEMRKGNEMAVRIFNK